MRHCVIYHILLTSMGQRGDAKRMEAVGLSGYLTKPVKESQLFDCIVMVMGAERKKDKMDKVLLVTRHTLNGAQRERVRLLLIEDNPVNQKVAARILRKADYLIIFHLLLQRKR